MVDRRTRISLAQKTAGLGVVASPKDTYYRPNLGKPADTNVFSDLAQGLNNAAPGVNRYIEKSMQLQDEEDANKAAVAATMLTPEEIKANYVDTGAMTQLLVSKGYSESEAATIADDRRFRRMLGSRIPDQFGLDEFLQEGAAEQSNPLNEEPVESYVSRRRAEWAKANGLHIQKLDLEMQLGMLGSIERRENEFKQSINQARKVEYARARDELEQEELGDMVRTIMVGEDEAAVMKAQAALTERAGAGGRQTAQFIAMGIEREGVDLVPLIGAEAAVAAVNKAYDAAMIPIFQDRNSTEPTRYQKLSDSAVGQDAKRGAMLAIHQMERLTEQKKEDNKKVIRGATTLEGMTYARDNRASLSVMNQEERMQFLSNPDGEFMQKAFARAQAHDPTMTLEEFVGSGDAYAAINIASSLSEAGHDNSDPMTRRDAFDKALNEADSSEWFRAMHSSGKLSSADYVSVMQIQDRRRSDANYGSAISTVKRTVDERFSRDGLFSRLLATEVGADLSADLNDLITQNNNEMAEVPEAERGAFIRDKLRPALKELQERYTPLLQVEDPKEAWSKIYSAVQENIETNVNTTVTEFLAENQGIDPNKREEIRQSATEIVNDIMDAGYETFTEEFDKIADIRGIEARAAAITGRVLRRVSQSLGRKVTSGFYAGPAAEFMMTKAGSTDAAPSGVITGIVPRKEGVAAKYNTVLTGQVEATGAEADETGALNYLLPNMGESTRFADTVGISYGYVSDEPAQVGQRFVGSGSYRFVDKGADDLKEQGTRLEDALVRGIGVAPGNTQIRTKGLYATHLMTTGLRPESLESGFTKSGVQLDSLGVNPLNMVNSVPILIGVDEVEAANELSHPFHKMLLDSGFSEDAITEAIKKQDMLNDYRVRVILQARGAEVTGKNIKAVEALLRKRRK